MVNKVDNSNLRNIKDFWNWFVKIASQLEGKVTNHKLISELDKKILELGNVFWEIGSGIEKENSLVISPGGIKELIPVTKEIVKYAPDIDNWEFHYVKPPKVWEYMFYMEDSRGGNILVNAKDWEYVLYKFPDGTFDILINELHSGNIDAELRDQAAAILVEGTLGEENMINYIGGIEVVTAWDNETQPKSNKIPLLKNHFKSLLT